ncbi:MAG: c-type cytochrome biogenesis protein CcmI [Alteromonadales bacterium]|nr:c-type cytochrome biogenesis protein CcmI [Alteromonadales bacterium]
MIVQFWLGAILLLIIASTVFVAPFLATVKRKQDSTDKRNELNRALYDVRVAELESDEDQGLLVDKEKIISELQHNLLDDINDQKLVSTDNKNKLLWLPGLVLLIIGSVALYWKVGAYQELTKWEDTLQRYPALQSKLFNDREGGPTEQELRDIMLGLRTQLAKQPNDADGWLLYSRLGMVFKDADLSLDAIKKAYQLDQNSVDIRLVYAQLKMQRGDEYSQQQAELILQQLLIDEPMEIEAWSMYAFMALEQQDFPAAIQRWEKMLTLVDVESDQAQMLRGSINYAKKQIQEQQGEVSESAHAESNTAR